jgi:hypothetical protein
MEILETRESGRKRLRESRIAGEQGWRNAGRLRVLPAEQRRNNP